MLNTIIICVTSLQGLWLPFPNLLLISTLQLLSLVDLFHVIKVRSTFLLSLGLYHWPLSTMINLDRLLSILIFGQFFISSSYSIKPIVISINNPFRGFVAFMLLCGKWCLFLFLSLLSRQTDTHTQREVHSLVFQFKLASANLSHTLWLIQLLIIVQLKWAKSFILIVLALMTYQSLL